MATMLMVICCAAVAEGTMSEAEVAEKLKGVWYVNQLTLDGITYDVTQEPNQIIIDFNDDTTATLYTADNEETKTQAAWTVNENGEILFMEAATQVPLNVTIEDDYLIIGNEKDYYLLRKEPKMAYDFAEIVKAESANAFDGKYAVTYVSGNGYTMDAETALKDMSRIGITSTGIVIKDSLVEFLGKDPQQYLFNEKDGTLEMIIDGNPDFTNVYVFKLADGGIAANWMDLTFYASPVTAD